MDSKVIIFNWQLFFFSQNCDECNLPNFPDTIFTLQKSLFSVSLYYFKISSSEPMFCFKTEILQALGKNYVPLSVLHPKIPFTHNQTKRNPKKAFFHQKLVGSVVTNSAEMPRKLERCNSNKLRLEGRKNKS